MIFLKHTVICTGVLFLIWVIPLWLLEVIYEIEPSGDFARTVLFFTLFASHFALFFVYYKYKKGSNLVALSRSHFIFPVLVFIVAFFILPLYLGRPPSENAFSTVMVSIFYFGFTGTIILSISRKQKNKNHLS